MSRLDTINVAKDGIGHILADKRLAVPPYQRSYAWTEREVEQLYQDIGRAIQSDEKQYFLGSIVVTGPEEGAAEVVDGQQRLATTAILLAAIRDYFCEQGDTDRGATVESGYLCSRDLRTQELVPRIRLNEMDDDFFRKRVLSRPGAPDRSVEATRKSHRLIMKAADVAATKVANIAGAMSSPSDYLADWVEFLRARAVVILVTASSDANAFVIFETLNDRGLSLAVSDLLKNLLFRMASERLAEVQQRWSSMCGIIEAAAPEENLVAYIRHMWSSEHGLTRERQLYERIAEAVRSRQDAVDLATDLEQVAHVYAALLNPDHEYWAALPDAAADDMRTLNMLGMVQMRPLLLAVLNGLPKTDVAPALGFLVSCAVRFLITGKLGSGPLEDLYCRRAKQIRDGGITTASRLREAMLPEVPSDADFEAGFRTATVSKVALARYYLSCLENERRGGQDRELVANRETTAVNLEHVLPEHPSAAWGAIDPDEASRVYRRLGNLALMRTRVNSDLGNRGFAAKVPHYAQSELVLTKHIAGFGKWGVEEIEARQNQLAELAVRAWPR